MRINDSYPGKTGREVVPPPPRADATPTTPPQPVIDFGAVPEGGRTSGASASTRLWAVAIGSFAGLLAVGAMSIDSATTEAPVSQNINPLVKEIASTSIAEATTTNVPSTESTNNSTTTAAPSTTTVESTTRSLPSTTTTAVPTTRARTTSAAPTNRCDPNYSGCVPVASDVDCAGGSGNGPAYVRGPVQIIGSDIYGLDRDNDGIGCE